VLPEGAENAENDGQERFGVASESHATEKVDVSYGGCRAAAIT
jgi:hypothetical protein